MCCGVNYVCLAWPDPVCPVYLVTGDLSRPQEISGKSGPTLRSLQTLWIKISPPIASLSPQLWLLVTGCKFWYKVVTWVPFPPLSLVCDQSVAVFQFPGEFVKSFLYQIKGQLSAGAAVLGLVSVFWCDIVMEWELVSLATGRTPGPGWGRIGKYPSQRERGEREHSN